jgi:hypothetical protein
MGEYRWEYSPLADAGNWLWKAIIDPALRTFAADELTVLRRVRGVIQVVLLVALLMLAASLFYSPGHMITGSGLLFDIAGALRLFIVEGIESNLSGFKENEFGNVPSVAMRELIMPEASGPYDATSDWMSQFYYKKRAVLFLFIGFVLQMIGDLVG